MSLQSILLSDPNHSFFVNLVLKQLILELTSGETYLREKKEMCLNIEHSNSKRGKGEKNIHLVKT